MDQRDFRACTERAAEAALRMPHAGARRRMGQTGKATIGKNVAVQVNA
jgi:hypothetical protein